MKLFIEVELSPDEIPLATELFRTLRALTDHVKTRDAGKLFQALISRLEDGTQLDRVSNEVATILNETMSADTVDLYLQTLEEFQAAFVAVVFNHNLVLRQQSVVPFMFLLPRLPDQAKGRMRDFLIPKVLKHLTVKRAVEASRMDFFAHAEAFAALVNLEFVSINGAITTIITLLRKPETRCAAVTMLGKTVELCLQQLTEKCDPSTLQELNIALQNVNEDAFQYDINYIEESMGWSRPLHGIGASHDIPSSGSLTTQGEMSKGMSMDSLAASSGLHALESYFGHCNTIFAMSYAWDFFLVLDGKRHQLISGGKDGTLIVWTSDGQPATMVLPSLLGTCITSAGLIWGAVNKVAETMDMARHYPCSMDIHSSYQTLLVCSVAKEENNGSGNNPILPLPCIHRYAVSGRGWMEQGILSKDSSKLVSCIRVMGGVEHAFVTGETIHTASQEGGGLQLDERVCYYDINASSSFENLSPVRQYTEHEDLITCLSLFPPNRNLFFSGSRDSSVRVWDRRLERCVGMFGTLQMNGRVQAHEGMITCLDAMDTNFILSTGMDARVQRWDFRSLANSGGSAPVLTLQLDGSPVLKVALGGGPRHCAAASTLRGLYMVDFAGARPVVRPAEPFKDGRRIGRYHDLKWAKNVLYAAGDDMRIDVYSWY